MQIYTFQSKLELNAFTSPRRSKSGRHGNRARETFGSQTRREIKSHTSPDQLGHSTISRNLSFVAAVVIYSIHRPREMDRYTIAGRIGEGAHGLVLKAYDNATPARRPVALKRVLLKRIEDGIPTSVVREVKTLQRLKHPYVRIDGLV